MTDLDTQQYLIERGFEFGVYSDPQGVYYTAKHNRDLVFVDVREAYSLQTLRDMYKECFEHLKVFEE